MKKKLKFVGALLLVLALPPLSGQAAVFSNIMIDGTLNFNSISFTPANTQHVVNGIGTNEFTSVVAVNNDTAQADVYFNFEEEENGGSYLNLRALFEGDGVTEYYVDGFSVTFSNIINSTPGSYFAGMDFVGDSDYGSLHPGVEVDDFNDDPLQGISFTLVFTQFYVVNYGRHVELELTYRNVNDGAPVPVPVPAAAPMALLGLGMLALARRFRRTKS